MDGAFQFEFMGNDQYLVANCQDAYAWGNGETHITAIDTDTYLPQGTVGTSENRYNCFISNDGLYAVQAGSLKKPYIDANGKPAFIDIGKNNYVCSTLYKGWFTNDNTSIITIEGSTLVRYGVDLTGNTQGKKLETFSFYNKKVIRLLNGNAIYGTDNGWHRVYRQVVDGVNMLGIIYKGEEYYKINPEAYTAETIDVRLGKSFMGKKGIPEVGKAIIGDVQE